MEIRCPSCGRAYLLPESLMGEQGARVRCPGCESIFVVAALTASSGAVPAPPGAHAPDAGPEPAAQTSAPAPAEPAVAAMAADVPPGGAGSATAERARALVAEWLGSRRESVMEAAARDQVWSRFGAEMAGLYDRLRAGSAAAGAPSAGEDAAAFRAALRELAGIELRPDL